LCGGHAEGVDSDRCRVVPVGVYESSPFENLLRLDTMLVKGVSEEDDVFMASLMFVLVVLLGYDR
jgi:hypothetical protein